MDCIRKPLQALRHDKSETPAEEEVPLQPEQDQQHHHRHHKLPSGDINGKHHRHHPDLRHPTHRYDVPKRHHIHTTDTELQTDFDLTDEDEPPPPPPYHNTNKHNQYPHQHRPRNNNPPPHDPHTPKPNRYNTNRIKRTPSLDAYIFAYGSEKELAEDLYPIPLDVDLSPSEPQFPLPTPRGPPPPPAMGTHDPTHNHHSHSHHHHPHRHYHYENDDYDDYDDYEDDYYPRGRDPRPRENTNTKPPWAHPKPAAPPPPAPASESTAASIRSDRRRVQANDARPRKRDSKRDSGATGGGGSSATATSDFAYANGDGGGGGGRKGGRRREEEEEGWPLPLPPAGRRGNRREKGGGGGAGGKVSINDEDYDYGGQWDGDDGGVGDRDRDRDRGDVDAPPPPPIFVNGTELSLRSKENLRDADADDAYLKPDAGGRGRDPLWSPGWEVSSIHTFSGGEGDVDADGFVSGGEGGRGFFDHARARRRNERAGAKQQNNHPYGFERAGGWRGGGEPEFFDTGRGRNAGEWERDWSPSPYASPTVSDDDDYDDRVREAGHSPHPNARRDRVKKKKQHHHDKHRGRKPERSPEPISPRTPAPPAPPTSGSGGGLSRMGMPRTPSQMAGCALGATAVAGLCCAGVKKVVSEVIKSEVEKRVEERLWEERLERRRKKARKKEEKERRWRERDRLERERVTRGPGFGPGLRRRVRSGGLGLDGVDEREWLFKEDRAGDGWVDESDRDLGYESSGGMHPGLRPRKGWKPSWSRSRTREDIPLRPTPRRAPDGARVEPGMPRGSRDKGKGVDGGGWRRSGVPGRRLLSDHDTSELASFSTFPASSMPAHAHVR